MTMATRYAEEEVKLEHVSYEWYIPSFDYNFEILNRARQVGPNPRERIRYGHDYEINIFSEEFLRGQHVKRTSVWKLGLSNVETNLKFFIICENCLHKEIKEMWANFKVDIVDIEGNMLHSSNKCESKFISENERNYFMPWCSREVVIIPMAELHRRWEELIQDNVLKLRLSLLIYRDKPVAESQYYVENHEPLDLTRDLHLEKNSAVLGVMRKLWETRDTGDIHLKVDGHDVKVHDIVVSDQLKGLGTFIKKKKTAGEKPPYKVIIEGVKLPIFEAILKYAYMENVEELKASDDPQFILDILKAANYFQMKPLERLCLARLLELLTLDNFSDIAPLIYSSATEDNADFKKGVKLFFLENQKEFEMSDNFKLKAQENKAWFIELCFEPLKLSKKAPMPIVDDD